MLSDPKNDAQTIEFKNIKREVEKINSGLINQMK